MKIFYKKVFTGYIYKMTGSCGKVYIGSTKNISSRKASHKDKNNKTRSNLLLKPVVFDIIDTRQYRLRKTLRLVEQYFIDNINNINDKRAYTNYNKYHNRYNKNNREKYNKYAREWGRKNRIKNRKKVNQYAKEWGRENRRKKRLINSDKF